MKISEWIRGSSISWTNAHNKASFSYGNHCGKDINFWRRFIKQCHVASVIKLQLKSMIKGSGNYAVHGIYYPCDKGRAVANSDEDLLLPQYVYSDSPQGSRQHSTSTTATEKRKREGKGSTHLRLLGTA